MWHIVADSSCDIKQIPVESDRILFSTVPFTIRLDQKEYVDDDELNVGQLVEAMAQSSHSQTACPSPHEWLSEITKADQTIAITISSQLSGSFASAMTARGMALEENPEKQIAVIDSCSTGPKLILMVKRLCELIGKRLSFEEVTAQLRAYSETLHTVFTLSSFQNLARNGRILRVAGLIASKLNLRVIGAGSPEGKIVLRETLHGDKRVISALLAIMRGDGFAGGEVAISHCGNPTMAEALAARIREAWQSATVLIVPTRGLCSYYAEKSGIILSY